MRLIDSETVKEYLKRVIWGADSKIDKWVEAMPTIDAIPVEWLKNRREGMIFAAMTNSQVYGNNTIELCHAVNVVLDMWREEQEART